MSGNNAVLDTIQVMTSKIFESIDSNLIEVLDRLLYVDESLFQENSFIISIYKMTVALRLIAESIIFGQLLYYIVRYSISRITGTSREDMEEPAVFFFKLIIAGIAVHFASDICREFIRLNASIAIDLKENMLGITSVPSFRRFLLMLF